MKASWFVSGCLAATMAFAQNAPGPSVAVGNFDQEVREFFDTDSGLDNNDVRRVLFESENGLFIETAAGISKRNNAVWTVVAELPASLVSPADTEVLTAETGVTLLDAASGPDGTLLAGAAEGLFFRNAAGEWGALYPRNDRYSWAPTPVPAVAYDSEGRPWFASPQGVGYYGDAGWMLFTGAEGLPWNEFTSMAAGPDGSMWFGTTRGVIRWDGEDFRYRQGLRWLPDDEVRDIAVDDEGSAWIATAAGLGRIGFRSMTLAEKAEHYESLIDDYNRRTEYGFVLESRFSEAGNLDSEHRIGDSDNDGLWTSMYGAGECYAYAATGSADAKRRAKLVWEAMKKLGTVTQGGSHPAPEGFVARTILPAAGEDPNAQRYTPEGDRRKQEGDSLWKVIDPRWPLSEDGEWYWKSDTSSDELDGHYYFYALYYDLVCETESEKAEVRERVRALTDHLIEHDFFLVDHTGTPTRWARYNPYELNHDVMWFIERGLNSLSMLSYLAVAHHMTGDEKYREVADMLIEDHGYAQNVMFPKFEHGAGSGNQSDDEMAVMCYYNLLKYETDPDLRARYALSWREYWRILEPEVNPFFNFAFAAQCSEEHFQDAFDHVSTAPSGPWLEDSVEQLLRFPLDRFNWRHTNSHRLDLVQLPPWTALFDREGDTRGRGTRVNGDVIPMDECYFNHYNRDPFEYDTGGSGDGLGSGTVFLLPYYMGLYHGFIEAGE
jgi:hypothetical protein